MKNDPKERKIVEAFLLPFSFDFKTFFSFFKICLNILFLSSPVVKMQFRNDRSGQNPNVTNVVRSNAIIVEYTCTYARCGFYK